MLFAMTIDERNDLGPADARSPRLERLSFMLALLVGAVLSVVSVNDFRTGLAMLAAAAKLWPFLFHHA